MVVGITLVNVTMTVAGEGSVEPMAHRTFPELEKVAIALLQASSSASKGGMICRIVLGMSSPEVTIVTTSGKHQ